MPRSDLRGHIIDHFGCARMLSQLEILDSAIAYFALEIVTIGDGSWPGIRRVAKQLGINVWRDNMIRLVVNYPLKWNLWNRRFENQILGNFNPF